MYKFTEDGKGPMHLRFFTILIDKQKVNGISLKLCHICMCDCHLLISCVGPNQLKQLIKISNQVNKLPSHDDT